MRHAQSSAYQKTIPNQTIDVPPDAGKRPIVERIAGWSARHRKTAIFGWLLLVFAIIAVGQVVGSKSAIQYDPGQSGQAERALHQLTGNDTTLLTEDVLIQARSGNATYEADPAMRTVPSLGRSRPPSTCRSVVLPEPDAPTIAMRSPAHTRIEAPRSTCSFTPPWMNSLARSLPSRTTLFEFGIS